MKWHKPLQAGTVPTWWLPHFVPVNTKAGSSISFSSFSNLYTWVPRHLTFVLCREIVVSMGTALGSTGLEAELWHWIFPHLASLISKEKLSDYFWLDECFAGFSFACELKCEALLNSKKASTFQKPAQALSFDGCWWYLPTVSGGRPASAKSQSMLESHISA